MVPGVSHTMIQDDQVWYHMIYCNALWYDAMALAYKLFVHSFSLLKSLFFFFDMATYAKCTNQDSNCVYAGTNLWHKGWHDTNMIWYVCNGRYRSLMCTSNVAGNTQMASLDRQVTQNGLGVINAIAREIYKWRDTTIPRWYGGYRPRWWWVAVILMEIPRWWRLVPK